MLASVKMAAGDKPGAEAVLNKVAEQDPKSPDVAVVLGRFYWAEHRKQDALSQFHRAVELDPKNGPALWDLARTELAGGDVAGADQLYGRLSRLPDKSYRPFHALFLLQQNKPDAAIQELERLADADPRNTAVRDVLVQASLETGRAQRALERLSAVIKKYPKDEDALFLRSRVYLRLGRAHDAEGDIQQVVHFNSQSAPAHLQLARTLEAEGDQSRQMQELDTAIHLRPDLLQARLQMAALLLSKKDANGALALMDNTPDSQKNTVPVIIAKNWALIALDSPEARKGVDTGLSLAKAPALLIQDAVLEIQTEGLRRSPAVLAGGAGERSRQR